MTSGLPWTATDREDLGLRWLADYIELTKPRIGVMVLVTVAIAAVLATGGNPEPLVLLSTLLGTGFVAASASVWNHWWEQESDSWMQRTRGRCLPAGRLPSRDAVIFGTLLLIAGVSLLLVGANAISASVAVTTWIFYVLVYTPLKRKSVWNTAAGAIPGALPVLIGWTAMGEVIDLRALALLAVVFLWQFPHFMAIAWRYRHDYAAAGMKMVTVVDPSGQRAGRQAVLGALALLPISLIPTWSLVEASWPRWGLIALGVWFLSCAVRFHRCPCDSSAMRLLRASLVYLPLAMAVYGLLPWLT